MQSITESNSNYDNLESEQEKLFGAAKKKMDEEIKTGVLPQSNSQMPRAKVPYHDRIGSQSSIGGGKKMKLSQIDDKKFVQSLKKIKL